MTRKMILSPLNDGDLLYVARNMREADKQEIYATRWSENPNVLVDDCMRASSGAGAYTVMAGLEKPIAVLGAAQPWPGVFDVWCFATPDFNKIAFSLTKHIRRVMIPLLIERGAHRAHCRSLASHTEAHEWLKMLGARERMGVLKDWGKGGEDFLMFQWHLEDFAQQSEAAA